ncbi:lipopolysaccharide biosynthesis protein [Halovibrio sp. HP20-50]|uniref:lipopolysaccharide biosynthesis protein n=1 Tax=Halovibrio sp. HP20-59 TaxID=3080275 RepID=UPI00294B3BA7|nr:oligosaccharide flippase family protein [Halovibrio sp. HP20-59]MEA2120519.1 oligosaccharide flippase family protein [Halovibrio sp. HP20-59]
MISVIKRATSSKFVRNVAIVATGTAGAQAIIMAFAPIITRLYGPEAFGVLGTFTAILAVIMPLAAFSYPVAIVLPKHDADARGLAKLSIKIAAITCLLVSIVLLVFKTQLVNAFNLQEIESFVLLLPVAMLFSACMSIMSQWVVRKKLFKIKAKIAVLQALWVNSAKAGVGLFFPVATFLIILSTLGGALHALMLWNATRKSAVENIMNVGNSDKVNITKQRELAWKYRDFVYYRTPQVLFNTASANFPVIILASLFGTSVAGFYALARMALSVPSKLISKSITTVFYPKITEVINARGDAKGLIIKATLALALLNIVPYGIIVAFGPTIFSFVFGEEWFVAGEYARWMSIFLFAAFITGPSIAALPALSKQGFFLSFEIFSFIVRMGAIYLGYRITGSDILTVAILSITGFFIKLLLPVFTVFFAQTAYQDNVKADAGSYSE